MPRFPVCGVKLVLVAVERIHRDITSNERLFYLYGKTGQLLSVFSTVVDFFTYCQPVFLLYPSVLSQLMKYLRSPALVLGVYISNTATAISSGSCFVRPSILNLKSSRIALRAKDKKSIKKPLFISIAASLSFSKKYPCLPHY
ncbi:MAG: hypothetical protein ACFFD4_31150 [Candidatus Odinarchaeota archaeon]